MKHVVFVVGSYYPHYSAVGNCAEKVISEMKNEFSVSVVSIKNNSDLKIEEPYDGCDIHRVESTYQKKLNELAKKTGLLTKIQLYKLRLFNVVKFLFRKKSVDPNLINSYQAALVGLNQKRKIDVLIPLVFPFETVMACIAYQEEVDSSCVLLPYLFDNFSNSVSLHRFSFNRALKFSQNQKLEKLMLERASHVYAMHPLSNHFLKTATARENLKISYVEHPLLLERNFSSSNKNTNYVTFTYTGGLFRGVRTANSCLNLLDKLSNVIPLKVKFYCFGNDLSAVYSFSKKKPNVFKNFGMVAREIAEKAIDESDVLISIGDVEGKQLSSKIFDYLSMGKPIIHFSYVESCVNAQLLSRYPLGCVVLQRESCSQSIVEEVSRFAIEMKGKTIKFSDVSQLYPEALPLTTARLFKEYINSSRS